MTDDEYVTIVDERLDNGLYEAFQDILSERGSDE